jgi:hypothetical protein
MIDWIDKLLLSVSRDTMDVVAMVLTAAVVAYLAVLLGKVAWSIGRHDDMSDETDERGGD